MSPALQKRDPSTEFGTNLVLFLFGALSFAPFFSLYQSSSIHDEGIIAVGAVRLLSGEALYTDFNTHIAPGTYLLTWLSFWVLGPSVLAVRLLAAAITGGLALCVYLLARRCLSPRWALVPYALMLCAGVTQWPILSYHWLGVLGFLIGTVLLARWMENPQPTTALIAGLGMALTGWLLQSEAAALLLLTAMVAWWQRAQMTRSQLAAWWAGCGAGSLLLWAPVLSRTSVSEIWRQNVLWALGHNAAQGRSPYTLVRLQEKWEPFLGQAASHWQWSLEMVDWALHSLSYLAVWSCNYGLFYPVLALAAVWSWKHPEERAFRLLVLAQVASVLAWSSRQTLLYLNFLTPLFFILAVVLARRAGRLGVTATVVTCLIYGTGYLYQWREARDFRYPITTVRGTLLSKDPQEGQMMSALFARAYQLTPPGTAAFCYPYAMGFSFLSGIRPVSKLSSVIPLLGEDSEVPGLLADLEREQVQVIYHFPWSDQTLHAVPLVEKEKFWSLVKSYDQMILKDFEPVAPFPIATAYQRKAKP